MISLRKGHYLRLQPAHAPRPDHQHHVQEPRCAIVNITVNNPSIWRPILSIEDAATAYVRAIEANQRISGIFNIASGNYTVGEVGRPGQERRSKSD